MAGAVRRHDRREVSKRGKKLLKANCRECNILITNQKNVGDERHVWPGPRTDYLCLTCHMQKAERLIERTRGELRLQGERTDQRRGTP
jgi:hypothetical protein